MVSLFTGSGSVNQCFFDPGIRDMFFPDLGSRIPAHISESLVTVWVKSTVILCQVAQIFFRYAKFVAGKTTNSKDRIRDPG
jgi:hypothetical protein